MIRVRVIKLGGSLLQWPGLRSGFRAWRAAVPYSHDLLVVGGGAAADWVREADRTHQFGDDVAHHLAIEAMRLNAGIAAALWPEAAPCSELTTLRSVSRDGLRLFHPWPALSDAEQAKLAEPLLHSWDVTSDSIAAWLARAIGARELVLLKSALPRSESRQMAIDDGYVDRHFAIAARGIETITAVNLRSVDFESRRLTPNTEASDAATA